VGDIYDLLRSAGVQPTPQRVAVARYVLGTTSHPTADQVLARARRECPTLSRATVYNTLARLAERGLLRPQTIKEGVVVFDAHTERHHHFIDDATGRIYDVPWEALSVSGQKTFEEYDIRDYQVVMRGRRRRP
jgi:Fe2+ or Zn2+ uptake regulation protein